MLLIQCYIGIQHCGLCWMMTFFLACQFIADDYWCTVYRCSCSSHLAGLDVMWKHISWSSPRTVSLVWSTWLCRCHVSTKHGRHRLWKPHQHVAQFVRYRCQQYIMVNTECCSGLWSCNICFRFSVEISDDLLHCPGRGVEYCNELVCLCVCLSVCLHAYLWNCWTYLHEFFVQIPCGRGSVVLWWLCDTLCTSGFMDDVTFGHSWPYGSAWKAETLTYYN